MCIAYVLMSISEWTTLSYWEITGFGNGKYRRRRKKNLEKWINLGFSIWAAQQLTHCTSVYSFNSYNRMIDDTNPSTIRMLAKSSISISFGLVLFAFEKMELEWNVVITSTCCALGSFAALMPYNANEFQQTRSHRTK